MFSSLKEKFKGIAKKFSEESEKAMIVEKEETPKEELEEKEGVVKKVKQAIATKKISDNQFEEMFWDLEMGLLENNLAVEVIEKLKDNLKVDLVDNPIEKSKIKTIVEESLKETVKELFQEEPKDLVEEIKKKEGPYIILFLGVNGSGKTTTIAKVAKYLQTNNLKPVLAASDTFRAAAIDQLQHHAEALNIPIVKHDYGSDPAAVAFDAIKFAKAKEADVVLIDTAGRMHSNINLMDELKKVTRVANPDFKMFIGESITGNDCVEQAKRFEEAVGINGITLTKTDVDNKGGAAVSISYITGKPIYFMGYGQEYGDIEKFNLDKLIGNLGW